MNTNKDIRETVLSELKQKLNMLVSYTNNTTEDVVNLEKRIEELKKDIIQYEKDIMELKAIIAKLNDKV